MHTVIDVNKSLVPINPEAFSEGLTYDGRGGSAPLLYAAKNVLPTDLGYMSYFGTANSLGDALLDKDVQEILSFRTLNGDTILFALCRDGCYFKALAGEGVPTLTTIAAAPPVPARIQVDLAADEFASWTFLFNSPQGSTSPWHLWTYALLENKLYLYQKGMKYIARIISTEKGQFYVDKVLPTFIISAVSKIYKYLTNLISWSDSVHLSRTITIKGVNYKVPTTTPAQVLLLHNYLYLKLASAGYGAYLSNYLVSGPPAYEEVMFQTTSLAPTITGIEYNSVSVLLNNPVTWNFVLSIRGVALGITSGGAGLTLSQRVQDVYTKIKDGLVSAGIPDTHITGLAIVSSDGSATTGAVSVEFVVGKVAGNYTVTKTSGDVDITISTGATLFPLDITNYKYARVLILNMNVTPVAGRVVSFSDSLYGLTLSYTTVTGDTRLTTYDKLRVQARKQGFDAFIYKNNVVDATYAELFIILPEAQYIDGVNPVFNIASSGTAARYSYMQGKWKEKVPSLPAQLTITHNGSGSDITLNKFAILDIPVHTDIEPTGFELSIPSTGGTLVLTVNGINTYSIVIPSWTTLAEAFTAFGSVKTALDPHKKFTAWIKTAPRPTAPTESLVINIMITSSPIWWQRITYLQDAPPTLAATFNGTTITTLVGYSLPNSPLEYTFESGWDLYVGNDYGDTISWVINGNAGSLNRVMGTDYTGYRDAWIAALAATPTVNSVSVVAIGFNADGAGGTGVCIKFKSTGYAIGLINNIATFTQIWVKDRTQVLHPSYVSNLAYTQFGKWYEQNFIKVNRSAQLTSATITANSVVTTISIVPEDDNEDIMVKIKAAISGPVYYRDTVRLTTANLPLPIKYSGDIGFSVGSLDGSDPLVSVGPTSADEPFVLTSATNELIELAQVEGICQARGRLLAWDYLNSINIGSGVDPTDFTPAIATQANVYKVDAIKGNIVLVLPHPEGVIIYSTGNIVKSTYVAAATQQIFKYISIGEYGSIDPRHITIGKGQHFFMGSKGLHSLDYSTNEVAPIGKELIDYLNSYKYPIELSFVAGRYLILNLQEAVDTISMEAVRDGTATNFEAGTDLAGYVANPVQTLSLPDVAFGQNLFPTFQRALIYDVMLQKWGQLIHPYKTIFSINPFNQEGYPAEKDYGLREATYNNDVRSLAGILVGGRVVLFDDEPAASWLVYGKYKLSNSFLTKLLEVEAAFLDYPNASLQIEPSMDGRLVVAANIKQSSIFNTPIGRYPILAVARWFNIVIKGKFNLVGLTVRGKQDGKRP